MTIKIETKSGVFEIADRPGESILYSGLAQGLVLPYECATGTCGTCRARIMSGETCVSWNEAPGFSKVKRDKGEILMCQVHAAGDCVVRVPAEVCVHAAPSPRRLRGAIGATRLLTHDVMEFDVCLETSMPFAAGQFVVLTTAELSGGRAYSMVNYAPETDRLVFVVKRKPGGGFSEWLFAGSRAGAPISIFGALGRATLGEKDRQDLVIVAGGSGIAGMMSILDRAATMGHFTRHTGRVFFGVRTLADGFYLDRLARHVDEAAGALDVTLVLSHEAPSGERHPDRPAIRLGRGFVHEAAAQALSGGAEAALAFVAGPPPMVDGAIRSLLTVAKVPAKSIRFDKFG